MVYALGDGVNYLKSLVSLIISSSNYRAQLLHMISRTISGTHTHSPSTS
jgi:hypothetical protein